MAYDYRQPAEGCADDAIEKPISSGRHSIGSRLNMLRSARSPIRSSFGLLVLCCCFGLTALTCYLGRDSLISIQYSLQLSNGKHASNLDSLETAAVSQCSSIHAKIDAEASATRSNPRFQDGVRPTLVRNATLLNGDGSVTFHASVYFEQGVFKTFGRQAEDTAATQAQEVLVWDVEGRWITPGIVDMHSHAGVDALPEFWGDEDTNEISDPITSQVRVIDALNPSDPMFRRIMSGGVTTSLILPGSANLIGGEAYAIKMAKRESLKVEDYLVQAGVQGKRQRWLKMACGENPKRVYPDKVNTRLGEGWGFRHRFDQAKQLMQKQDAWCARAAQVGEAKLSEPFPSDLELESVVGVLRGDVQVNNHCYETHDLEARLRLADEFGFQIGAFHHAQDAYRVTQMLKDAPGNLTVAIFSTLWGYKKEAFQGSPYAGKVLSDAGVRIAYKSDHPVTNSQHLIYQAQQATHYDLDSRIAIQAVTMNPADSLGLGHRIGRVAPGYDADLVLWNDYPLSLGAHPLQVWIDGESQIDLDQADLYKQGKQFKSIDVAQPATDLAHELSLAQCNADSQNYIIKGITADLTSESDVLQEATPRVLVVSGGRVTCFDSDAACATSIAKLEAKIAATDKGATLSIVELKDGHLTPAIISTAGLVGLGEIGSESSTIDGEADTSSPKQHVPQAHWGLTFGGVHWDRFRASGVGRIVIAPLANGFLKGVSAAVDLNAKSLFDEDVKPLPKRKVAVHVEIGDDAKADSGPTSSVSGQIEALWKLLSEDDTEGEDAVWGQVRNGSLPLVATCHSSDEIAHLISLAKHHQQLQLVLRGATEAYVHAATIAALGGRVKVLMFPRCTPSTWRRRKCLPGPPLSAKTGFLQLWTAGVDVAFVADDDDNNLGEMYWEAAWQANLVNEYFDDADAGAGAGAGGDAETETISRQAEKLEAATNTEERRQLSPGQVVSLVSTRVAAILGLDLSLSPSSTSSGAVGGGSVSALRVGEVIDQLNIFEGSPLDLKAELALTIANGRVKMCAPKIKPYLSSDEGLYR